MPGKKARTKPTETQLYKQTLYTLLLQAMQVIGDHYLFVFTMVARVVVAAEAIEMPFVATTLVSRRKKHLLLHAIITVYNM